MPSPLPAIIRSISKLFNCRNYAIEDNDGDDIKFTGCKLPSSNRCPILRLLLLPFELKPKSLTPSDIFLMALSSRKVREYLRQHALQLEYVHLKLDTLSFDVKLPENMSDGCPFSLEWILLENRQSEIGNGNKTVKIDGKQYVILPENEKLTFLPSSERAEDSVVSKETFLSVYNLLSEIFTFQKVEIALCHVPKEVVLPLVTSNFRNIHKLCLYNPISKLTSDELSSLLEINTVEDFVLNWDVEEGVKYRKSLKCPKMTLLRAHWLTIDCLLNMDCVSLKAREVQLTSEDLKTFVKKLLEGGFEKLEHLDISHRIHEMSWNSVLNDLEKKPSEPMNREKHWFCTYHCDIGWKIERSDGKRALLIQERHSFNFFIF